MSGRPEPAVDDMSTVGSGAPSDESSPEAVRSESLTGRPDSDETPAILPDAVALMAERDDYLVALQRLQADFENYRKRVVRQQEEQSARAAADLVGKLLPVLDNLDLAWAHLGDVAESGSSEEARALGQARTQLLDVLAREGLERVDETAVPFDPTVHDAVAHAPADNEEAEPGGDVTIDLVMRAGYRWRGQVLRPAMVRVRG